MAEGDTWESRKNLKNAKELVKEFEREYREEAEEVQQQEEKENKKIFSRELLERFTAKILQRWSNKKYKRQREKRQKENQRQWKNPLEQGDLKRGPCYEMVPKEETIFHMFINLMGNIQEYNMEKI